MPRKLGKYTRKTATTIINDLDSVFGEGAQWIQNQCFLCWRHAVHENKRKRIATEQTETRLPMILWMETKWAVAQEGWACGCCCCGNKAPLCRQNAPIDKASRTIRIERLSVLSLSWRRQNTNANACRSTHYMYLRPSVLCVSCVSVRARSGLCVCAKDKQQLAAH